MLYFRQFPWIQQTREPIALEGAAVDIFTLGFWATEVDSNGTSAGVATVNGKGIAIGAGASAGSAAVVGQGLSFSLSNGSSAGVATVNGQPYTLLLRSGSSAGVATVNGQSLSFALANGTAAGTSTALGASLDYNIQNGSAAGSSTANGQAIASRVILADGQSQSYSIAYGITYSQTSIPVRLATGDQAEINPYPADVPDSIRNVSPELHDYLTAQARTIRDQHNVTQAGDTTFDWQVLLSLDDSAKYTPGSEGKFYHDTYGLFRAKYVQFGSMLSESWTGNPLGLLDSSGGQWIVTNDPSKSSNGAAIGLQAAFESVSNAQYGWVITSGINIQALYLNSDSAPTQWDDLTWDSDGNLAPITNQARVVGQYVSPAAAIVVGGSPTQWMLPPGTVAVDFASNKSDLSSINDRLTAVEDVLGGLPFPPDLSVDLAQLANQVSLNKQLNDLAISLVQNVITQLVDGDSGVQLTSQLQAVLNAANLAGVASDNANIAAMASNVSNRSAEIFKNQASYAAISASDSSNVAIIQAGTATIQAGVATGQAAIATAEAALASSYVSISASIGQGVLDKNPQWQDPAWSQDPATYDADLISGLTPTQISAASVIPPSWQLWNLYPTSGGYIGKSATGSKYGPNRLKIVRAAGANGTGNTDVGIAQTILPNIPNGALPKFYVDVDVTFDGGSWGGSGVFLNFLKAGSTVGTAYMDFCVDPRIDGGVGDAGTGSFQFSKLVAGPAGGFDTISFYVMAGWIGFSTAVGVNKLTMYPDSLKLRYASQGEVAGAGAKGYTDAQINITNIAWAAGDSALASTITALSATVSGNLTTTNAAIAAEASTRASADSSMATNITTLNSNYTTLSGTVTTQGGNIATNATNIANEITNRAAAITTVNSSITSEASTRASADSANASSITTLTGTVNSNYTSLSGSITTEASVRASAVTGIQAKYGVTIDVNGAVTGFQLLSGTGGSNFIVNATNFKIYSGTANPFSIVGGTSIQFNGDIQVNGGIRIGSLKIPIALQSFQLSAADGASVSFGTNLGNIPKLIFDSTHLAALASGEQYDVKALSLTSSGFTMSAKKTVPGTTASISAGPGGTSTGSAPSFRLNKGNTNDAYNGNYTFYLNVTINKTGPTGVDCFFEVECYIWSVNLGAWVDLGSIDTYVSGLSSGSHTIAISQTFYFADPVGDAQTYEFGVGPGGLAPDNCTVTSYSSLSVGWTYRTSSTTSTASPNGETVTVTVIPQNN